MTTNIVILVATATVSCVVGIAAGIAACALVEEHPPLRVHHEEV